MILDFGTIDPSHMTWKVDYYTGDAPPRPFVESVTGGSVSFTVPTLTPYTRTDVFYRISLTVEDDIGLTTTTTRDILPQKSLITVAASVEDVSVQLDGQPVGQIHMISASRRRRVRAIGARRCEDGFRADIPPRRKADMAAAPRLCAACSPKVQFTRASRNRNFLISGPEGIGSRGSA